MQKNMRYAHLAEICKKCDNKRNMQQSHIHIKLTYLTVPIVSALFCFLLLRKLWIDFREVCGGCGLARRRVDESRLLICGPIHSLGGASPLELPECLPVWDIFCLLSVYLSVADISLYTLWGVLSVAGFSAQCFAERNRPRFPGQRRRARRHDDTSGSEPGQDGGRTNQQLGQGRARTNEQRADPEQSERQPLLSAGAPGGYASVGLQQPAGDTWHSYRDGPTGVDMQQAPSDTWHHGYHDNTASAAAMLPPDPPPYS